MPAKDRHHDALAHALRKAGWNIDQEQVTLETQERTLWIDFRISKASANSVLLVELKEFENVSSPIDALANALGKYLLYRTILLKTGSTLPLAALPGCHRIIVYWDTVRRGWALDARTVSDSADRIRCAARGCGSMGTLNQQVHMVVAGYARKGLNGESYLTKSDDESVFTVVGIGRIQGRHISNVSLVVRVVDNVVIVERDQNDKPVVDALVQAGIPRERIILAYTGEPVPERA